MVIIKKTFSSFLVALMMMLPLVGASNNNPVKKEVQVSLNEYIAHTLQQELQKKDKNWIQDLAEKAKQAGDHFLSIQKKSGLYAAKNKLLTQLEEGVVTQKRQLQDFFQSSSFVEKLSLENTERMFQEELTTSTLNNDYVSLSVLNDDTLSTTERLLSVKLLQVERKAQNLKNEIHQVRNMKDYFYSKAQKLLDREFEWLDITFFDDGNNFFEDVLDLLILIVVVAGGFIFLLILAWFSATDDRDNYDTHTHWHDGWHHGDHHHESHRHTHSNHDHGHGH